MNLGPKGLSLATPEPGFGALLPTSDDTWRRGGIGTNPALYLSSFPQEVELGPFARACQASHMLGRLIIHRDGHYERQDRLHRLKEGIHLNSALMALDNYLSGAIDDQPPDLESPLLDLVLCTSARHVLYHMYACNEPDNLEDRHQEETILQAACIEGVGKSISTRARMFAKQILLQSKQHPARLNPLAAQVVYDAASETQWLIEEGEPLFEEREEIYDELVAALGILAGRWQVAGKFSFDTLRFFLNNY